MENVDIILKDQDYIDLVNRLEDYEKNRIYCKHDFEHFLDVARICYILILENKLDVDKDLVYVTALLHDIGRVIQIEEGIDHDKASVAIAKKLLAKTNFNERDKARIINAIGAHRKKEAHEDKFIDYFYMADKLSRMCFRCPARDLCYWPEEKKNSTVIY
ncbi:MAG: HD domain-containing protein [Finegoldia sp.]|nr:HD domain-containing protein [Finegoldia sp.]